MSRRYIQQKLDYNELFKHLAEERREIDLNGFKKMLLNNNKSEELYGHLARVDEFLLLEEQDAPIFRDPSQRHHLYARHKKILDTYFLAFEKTHSLLPLVRCVTLLESEQYSLGNSDLNQAFIKKCRMSYNEIKTKSNKSAPKETSDQPVIKSPTLLPRALGAGLFLRPHMFNSNHRKIDYVNEESEVNVNNIEDEMYLCDNSCDEESKRDTQEINCVSEDESTSTDRRVRGKKNDSEALFVGTPPKIVVSPSRAMREPDLDKIVHPKKKVISKLSPKARILKGLKKKNKKNKIRTTYNYCFGDESLAY